MRLLRSKRAVAALAALLLILFLFRPGIYRLRNRIAVSIGSALGRRVAIDNVRLRLLPRPGFDLEGLVIYDDPAFGAEPMIRAQDVSAAIRLRSLLRGRLEIATLSANEPSINLVRNDQGGWNLASLLERNAQIPAAPTAKPPSERRPAFPYLEASNARVNFKLGETKKSYALRDADVALWQDSENSWGARITAEPVRTDFNLTDTGLLQINATWQRASSLRVTPVRIAVRWQNGQLGQITKLLTENDRGWRGGVNMTAQISGTPEALQIESQTGIEDFHRYDIVDSENVRLTTTCSGKYNTVSSRISDLLCESPAGGGDLRLHGAFELQTDGPSYDLTLEADNLPLASMVRLLRQAKKNIPSDLIASGLLSGEFRAIHHASESSSQNALTQWMGTGQAIGVRLSSNANNVGKPGSDQIVAGTIPLALLAANSEASPGSRPDRQKTRGKDPLRIQPSLRIGPGTLSINGSPPLNAGGWLSGAGYRLFLSGDMDLQSLFRLENVLGLPGMRPAAEGSAKLDVNVSGVWRAFSPPITLGTAQLHNVRAALRGLNTPIEISSATVTLSPEVVQMQKISAHIGSTHWSGGVAAPRRCGAPNASASSSAAPAPDIIANCVYQFDLTADQLSTADLVEWFSPHPAKRPWYSILNSRSSANSSSLSGTSSNGMLGPSPLIGIQAHGRLHVGQFELKNVTVRQLSTGADLDRGKVLLTGLQVELWQGTHVGNWTLDISPQNPSTSDGLTTGIRYHGTGTLKDISLAQLGTLMNDDWIAGTANGSFAVDGTTNDFRGLLPGSNGKLQFAMRNGSLLHVEIPGSTVPLSVHRFTGELGLKKGVWELSDGRLESHDGIYQVNGTASASRGIDFVLTRGDEQSWTLSGTLAKPITAPGSRTVARRPEANVKP